MSIDDDQVTYEMRNLEALRQMEKDDLLYHNPSAPEGPDLGDEFWTEAVIVHPAAVSGAKREKLHALPYDLVPFQEMTEAYVRVAEKGAVKYAPWNWSAGLSRVQLLGSMLRHAFAYLRGQDRDTETGLLHTDHILWNAVSLSHNVHWNLEDGRRPEPERAYKALKK